MRLHPHISKALSMIAISVVLMLMIGCGQTGPLRSPETQEHKNQPEPEPEKEET